MYVILYFSFFICRKLQRFSENEVDVNLKIDVLELFSDENEINRPISPLSVQSTSGIAPLQIPQTNSFGFPPPQQQQKALTPQPQSNGPQNSYSYSMPPPPLPSSKPPPLPSQPPPRRGTKGGLSGMFLNFIGKSFRIENFGEKQKCEKNFSGQFQFLQPIQRV